MTTSMQDRSMAQETQEITQQRELTYRFLSAMYIQEVSRELLENMREEAPDTGGALDEFFASLATADLEQVRIDLAADYVRLFLGMSEQPVAPYESVYTSDTGLLMQSARDKVLALFRQEGLAIPEDFGLPEDHIALEFDFMAILSHKEAEAIEAEDAERAHELREKQKQFFTDHIDNWAPRMCDDVIKRATTDFYRDLARLTRTFVEGEKQYFHRL